MAIFVAGAGLALVWRQGRIRFYQAQAEAAVALRESEEKMHSIFRVAPTGIGVVSNRVLLEVNPRICEMTGYSKEELVGQSARIFYPTQEDFEFVGREKYKQIAQKGSGAVETRWQKKDGSIIDILLASTPIDLADLSKGVTFTALDITERKRLEHETEERRLFLESVLAVAPDAIVTSDTRHMISEWNLGAERLFGYSSEEAVGRKIDELITGTDSQVLNEAASWTRQIQSRRGIAPTETVRYRKDGSPVNFIVSVAPILIDNEWVGGVAIYTNITERKRAEEALQKSEESLRLAVSAGRMGTWDRNFLSGQLNWSVECKTMFGLAPEVKMNDERFMHALHPEDRMPTDLAIREALEKQTDFDTEYRVIWPDGTIHWIAAQGHGYYNEAGQAIRMTGVTFEITERKQAEDEIRKLNAELEQRVRERTLQLETTNKELEAFSYSVSHDLRAPLRGIDGWSQALLEDYRDKLDEQGRQYIERVRFETRRMGQLIEDMLQLSRLTRTEVIKEQVNLSALAQAIAERLQAAEPLRKVDFTIQAGLTAEGDAHLLEVMLTNLLGNAVKFTNKRADARIEFGGTESQGQRAFFVRDNGAGFDIAYAQKLFGAFQRMHKVSEFPGIGIGLATVRRIIHRHGGRVWAEAEVDRGATFYFTLG
jgi:PAS domain S-box-containing protein